MHCEWLRCAQVLHLSFDLCHEVLMCLCVCEGEREIPYHFKGHIQIQYVLRI